MCGGRYIHVAIKLPSPIDVCCVIIAIVDCMFVIISL